jgi:hypothetical protein
MFPAWSEPACSFEADPRHCVEHGLDCSDRVCSREDAPLVCIARSAHGGARRHLAWFSRAKARRTWPRAVAQLGAQKLQRRFSFERLVCDVQRCTSVSRAVTGLVAVNTSRTQKRFASRLANGSVVRLPDTMRRDSPG